MATMSKAMSRSFAQPDEQAEEGGVKIDVVYLGDIKVKRATSPDGWQFSKDMTPTGARTPRRLRHRGAHHRGSTTAPRWRRARATSSSCRPTTTRGRTAR